MSSSLFGAQPPQFNAFSLPKEASFGPGAAAQHVNPFSNPNPASFYPHALMQPTAPQIQEADVDMQI